jgi:hypothetical protein
MSDATYKYVPIPSKPHLRNAEVKRLAKYERVLILNLGQLGEIKRALELVMAVHTTFSHSSDYATSCTRNVLDRIAASIQEDA